MNNRYLFFMAPVLFFFSCQGQSTLSHTVSVDEFEKSIHQSPVQLLDVRTTAGFRTGYIAGTLQADWNNRSQFTERIAHLDKQAPVYIYCASGVRSSDAAAWMRKNGFMQVVELKGGLIQWKKANKSLEGGHAEKEMSLDEYRALIPATGTVLVDFGAEWCPPCVKMKPVLSEIEKETSDSIRIIKVDVGIHTSILKPLQVDVYPTLIVYKNGRETWRATGIMEKSVILSALQ